MLYILLISGMLLGIIDTIKEFARLIKGDIQEENFDDFIL